MKLPWNDYKKNIEGFLRRIFDNCKLIEDYENENLTDKYIYNFATEDNFYIKYICKSLESYICNYQKEYYGLQRGQNKQYKHCKECGKLIEKTNNRVMYCKDCAVKINREKTKEYTLWSGMLYRCYCDKNCRNRYKTYEDCYVDPRWFNFQNFCEKIIRVFSRGI